MPPKNELPTEAPTPTPDAMPGEMAAPMQEMAPQGGQVMVEMPSDAFDAIYALVTQLASGLESLKAEVDAQKGSANPEMAPESAEAPMPPEGAGTDEEFLKSIAEQGSVR
jgi:hypothetical protein